MKRGFHDPGRFEFPGLILKKITQKHWFHESAEILFSFQQYAENLLTRSLVPLKRGYHDSAKSHFLQYEAQKFYFSRVVKPRFVLDFFLRSVNAICVY